MNQTAHKKMDRKVWILTVSSRLQKNHSFIDFFFYYEMKAARGEKCHLNFFCEFFSEITIIYMQENAYCEVLHNTLLGKEGGDLLL